jgi:hypothetical protein
VRRVRVDVRPVTDGEVSGFSEGLPVVREHGLAVLCRVLFNSNEFLFIP